MRSLIIGGTRNLGPDLVAALRARGDSVTVLTRGVTQAELPADVARLKADRTDPDALRAALSAGSWDLVVDTTMYRRPEAEAVVSLLDGRAGRYVFWSTGQVYLVRSGLDRPFRETDYEGPVMDEPAGAYDRDQWRYGVDKRGCEDALRAAFLANGFPYVSLRMPMINSRRDHYGRLKGYAKRIAERETILIPDDQDALQLRHVYGDDVIEATLRAADASVPEGVCLNISQEEILTIETMLGIVGDIVGLPARLERRPRAELEASGYLPAGSPWSGRWMSVLDNELSKRLLGVQYTPVRDYLQALL